MKLAVIVVSYNTCDHLRACLTSLKSQEADVVVVDNASTDGSTEMVRREFPDVLLIESAVNLGFGRANNLGMRSCPAELYLFLNSDCECRGELASMSSRFKDPKVIAVGGTLTKNGNPQPSAANTLTLWAVFCEQFYLEKLFRHSFLDRYWVSPTVAKPCDVGQVMGACLMMRAGFQFDEEFFLYCEDTELCHRLKQQGRVLYLDTPFEHVLGASTTGRRRWSVAMYNRGKELFFRKHHGLVAMTVCWGLNRAGAALRLVAGIVTLNGAKVSTFWRVLWAPFTGPPLPEDAFPRP